MSRIEGQVVIVLFGFAVITAWVAGAWIVVAFFGLWGGWLLLQVDWQNRR